MDEGQGGVYPREDDGYLLDVNVDGFYQSTAGKGEVVAEDTPEKVVVVRFMASGSSVPN